MAGPGRSPRSRRRAGLERLTGLLDELRGFGELCEGRSGDFQHGSRPFLHFHFHPDGTIVADVRLSKRGFSAFDVTEEAGRQELLSAIEHYLEQ